MPSNAKAAVRPCPFCGGELESDSAGGQTWAYCDACGYTTPHSSDSEDVAAAHNRVALAVELHGELVELLRHAIFTTDELNDRRLAVLLARAAQSSDVEAEGGSDE